MKHLNIPEPSRAVDKKVFKCDRCHTNGPVADLLQQIIKYQKVLNKLATWKCRCRLDSCTCVSQMMMEASISLPSVVPTPKRKK